jgi:hypothetical protein
MSIIGVGMDIDILMHIVQNDPIIIIYGDEEGIRKKIDMIHEMIGVKGGDHVLVDGMYLVNENGSVS